MLRDGRPLCRPSDVFQTLDFSMEAQRWGKDCVIATAKCPRNVVVLLLRTVLKKKSGTKKNAVLSVLALLEPLALIVLLGPFVLEYGPL